MDKKNQFIIIHGAREHNLKNVDASIPKGKLTVVTGPSGSGKSSLVLDILYTEGQRRYIESLSSYARQFLGVPKRPDVESITGLCPAIAIEQKTVGTNPRSTVGTITEIYDYLRILYARIGDVFCPYCHIAIKEQSPDFVTETILHQFEGKEVIIGAPIAHAQKGEFIKEMEDLFEQGFYRMRVDGTMHRFKSEEDIHLLKLNKKQAHTIEILIDVISVCKEERSRLCEAIETAFRLANGSCAVIVDDKSHFYSMHRMCTKCGKSAPELEPRLFSFNSPIGACTSCQGLGIMQAWHMPTHLEEMREESIEDFLEKIGFQKNGSMRKCPDCDGGRLNPYALAVTVADASIKDLVAKSAKQLGSFFSEIRISPEKMEVGRTIIREITNRLSFLINVGLSYLTLDRTARTLSGGEGQRIRLATQIGSSLSGVLYVLDEPSIGLHQRDNDRLIETLKTLRDLDNTVVVVEHDIDTMNHADYLIDMGPAAGVLGGQITACGTPKEVAANKSSVTGDFLSGRRSIGIPKIRRNPRQFLTLENAHKNNLRDITVKFPLGVLCGISGVSGSGKSTLIMQELIPELEKWLQANAASRKGLPFAKTRILGPQTIENYVVIDQKPIGRTPRSNPASYLGIFDPIRKLFGDLPESNARGFKPGRFSFNVAEGRCQECRGEGSITVSMYLLPSVTTQCRVCKGKRYNSETLRIRYRGKTIFDVLELTAFEALEFFSHHQPIFKRLKLLCEVGLDYLKLGQPSSTLSGGEAQRIKLVDELAKRGKNTIYILDEPTTGLHSSDIERLLDVLNNLVDKGNSMLVIEHNLDVLKTVDYLIDMGPEGGDEGGMIVAEGTPEVVAANLQSLTGHYLKKML